MAKLLTAGLYVIGLSATLIGGPISIFGGDAVASFFNAVLNLIYSDGPIREFANANVDSELRFYGVWFAFYGLILIQTAQNIERYFTRVPILLLAFALAGLARVLGFIFTGRPHMLFTILMVIELVLPALLLICWYRHKKYADHKIYQQ